MMVPGDNSQLVPLERWLDASEEPRVLCIIRDMTTSDSQKGKTTMNLPASTKGRQLLELVSKQHGYEVDTFELVLQRMTDGESIVVNEHNTELELSQMGFQFGAEGRRNNLIVGDKNGEPPKKLRSSDVPISTEARPIKLESRPGMRNRLEDTDDVDNADDESRFPPIPPPMPQPNDVQYGCGGIGDGPPPPPRSSIPGSSYDFALIRLNADKQSERDQDSNSAVGYVGLVNQAMTCYLNSLLQTLFMTPEFRNALYRWEFDKAEDPSKSIPNQLQRLFLNLQTSNRHAVETTELTRSFGWDSSEAWQQHDVQELCRVMFDALEQKFRNTDQADLINRLYQGKINDYVKCLECGYESAREDTYLDIPLPVRPFGANQAFGSVEEALQAFVQPEVLDGCNQYFCEKCNRKCDAHKGLKFITFPYLLTLQLKRFDFDYTTMHRIKLNDRVTFQEILNLNSFIKCETEVETFDDSSTTDSGSALDEDNVSAQSSGIGESNQDDDEGIDMESGAGSLHQSQEVTANEKNLKHCLEKGPYLYELFSIMVHSGSANGGHYYAYIKSFKEGQWYCFNDQSVTKITHDDIRKTYGGGPTRSYYSGAYSSSTNAYMLMYRQIDIERNTEAITVDCLPEHIIALLKATQQQEEKERQQRELERNMCKIKLYWNDPLRNRMLDAILRVHKDTTLIDTTEMARQTAGIERTTPLNQCRLVKYDDAHDSLECSFEESGDQPIGEVLGGAKSSYRFSLLLEVWPPDKQPPVYRVGGTTVKVYIVNLKTEEVEGPVTVRSYLTQTVEDFKAQVAQALGLSTTNPRVVLERYYNDLRPLASPMKTLKAEGFYRSNKVFVELSDPDKTDSESNETLFQNILDRYENTISLHVMLPTINSETSNRLLNPINYPIVDEVDNERLERPASSSDISSGAGVVATNGESANGKADETRENGVAWVEPDYDEGIGDSEYDNNRRLRGYQSNVVHSDQSEDSSLTDSDRTIIGNSPPHNEELPNDSNYQRLDNMLSLRNYSSSSDSSLSRQSSCENDRNLSSPEENSKDLNYKETPYQWDYGKDEVCEPKEEEKRYFRAIQLTDPTTQSKMLRIRVDKRITLGALKNELAPYVGVPVDCFKVYRLYSNNQEYECTKLNENFVPFGDDTRIIIKVGRALRKGEYRVKIWQFLLNDPEPSRFLIDWIFAKGMTVLQAKKEILPEIKSKCNLDIPLNRCRLRKKTWQTPASIYVDSQRFEDDINIFDNLEVYLESLSEPEKFTSSTQLSLYLRWWHPSTFVLDQMREVVLDDYTLEQLKEKIHETSGIPNEYIDYAKGQGTFPYDISLLALHTDLEWNPRITHLNTWPLYICDDGLVVFFKDKREALKQLNDEERREVVTKENTKMHKQGRGVYSPRKERALKIYTDSRPTQQPSSTSTLEPTLD